MKAFKSSILIFALLFVAGLSLTLVQAAYATVTISDDGGDCYQVGKWKANNRTCTLNTDVSVDDGDGIDIDGNDIRLLCKGHSITGSGSGNGILVLPGKTDVRIEKCVVMNFTNGIFLSTGTTNTALKNNITNANSFGIYLSSSSNNILQNNVSNSNAFSFGQFSGTGIALDSSSNNVLKNNTAEANDVAGIALFKSSGNNTLKGNTADSNNDTGIVIVSSDDNELRNNTANSNQSAGIYLDNAGNNTLKNNTSDDNGTYGFIINDVNNTFRSNKCSGNSSGGSSPSGLCSSRNNSPIRLRGLVQSGGTGNIEVLKGARVTLYEATSGQPIVIGRGRTDKTGSFVITSTGSTSDGIFYITADLGRGTILAAMLGSTLPTHAIINELTTVAFTYSGAQFIDNGSVGGDAFGLRIAAGMNNNLVAVLSGKSSSVLLSPPNADETNALRSTRALANLLAACVRNGGDDCATLFDLATPSRGPQPTDTVEALLNIAHHPANNVEEIYKQSRVLEIYTPSLENQPDAWTLAVKVNDSGNGNFPFGGPGNLVFDYRGYAWITNNVVQGTTGSTDHSIVLKPDGSPSDGANGTPLSPITFGGLLGPGFGICKDTQGLIWISNFGWGGVDPTPSGSVSKFALTGQALSPVDGFQGGVFKAQGIISDQSNNIWIASFGNGRVVVYPGGVADNSIIFQGITGFLPFGIAIADDGTAWVTNANPLISSLSHFELVNGTLNRLSEQFIGHELKAIIIDPLGNIWSSSADNDTVYAFSSDGTLIGGFTGGGMSGPWGLAVDGDDNVWVGDFGPMAPGNIHTGRLTELAGSNPETRPAGLNMGDPISPVTGYTLPSAGSQVLLHNGGPLYGYGSDPSYIPMMRTTGVAIDQAGNVWTANNWKPDFNIDITSNPGGDGMVIFIGLAKPPRQD